MVDELPRIEPATEDWWYTVKNPTVTPPGGWSYFQPETCKGWKGVDAVEKVAAEVAKHRAYNSLDVGNPLRDVMHYTGALLIDRGMTERVETHQKVERNVSAYWHGLKGFVQIWKLEREKRPVFVSQKIATQRAVICLKCPKNVVDTGTSVAKRETNKMMRGMVGDRSTPLDDDLHTCKVCSCENKVMVHLSIEVLKNQHIDNTYPAFCWKHKAIKPS